MPRCRSPTGSIRGRCPPPTGFKEQELRQLISSFGDMTSRLKQLEQMRTDLLAGVSHELRTPLTSIRGMVQAVHGRVVAGAKPMNSCRSRSRKRSGCSLMVDDLLEFSSLEAGAIKTEPEKGPLSRSSAASFSRCDPCRRSLDTAECPSCQTKTSNAMEIRDRSSRLSRI